VKFDVVVEIESLEGLADPQGQTIERALPALGFAGVTGVHVGKVIRFVIDSADQVSAADEVHQLCDRLLANPVMERAEVALTPVPAAGAGAGAGAGPAPLGGQPAAAST
jgi:phosphoribosylformylglycinamidine synthase subunit PurS